MKIQRKKKKKKEKVKETKEKNNQEEKIKYLTVSHVDNYYGRTWGIYFTIT